MKMPRKRLLSVAALTAGVLAVGAGAAGLTISSHAHAAASAARLSARPSEVAAPTFSPVPGQTAQAPGGISGQTQVAPGYATVSALVSYRLSPSATLQLNADNLANARYYDSSHSDLELFPGAPISGVVTARYRF